HPDDEGQTVSAIMNSRVSNIDSLQADDINGARALYGGAASPQTTNSAPTTLRTGGRLLPGEFLASSDNRYRLVYQSDGNLVLYDMTTGAARWSTGTGATSAGQAVL